MDFFFQKSVVNPDGMAKRVTTVAVLQKYIFAGSVCFFFLIVDFKASINLTDIRVLGQCLSSPLNNEATGNDVNMTYLS